MAALAVAEYLDHFVVPVNDLIAAEEFYVRDFGGIVTKQHSFRQVGLFRRYVIATATSASGRVARGFHLLKKVPGDRVQAAPLAGAQRALRRRSGRCWQPEQPRPGCGEKGSRYENWCNCRRCLGTEAQAMTPDMRLIHQRSAYSSCGETRRRRV